MLIASVVFMGNTAEALSLKLLPNVTDSALQNTFTPDVRIEGVGNLGSFSFDLSYDPAVLSLQSADKGTFPESTGRTFIMLDPSP